MPMTASGFYYADGSTPMSAEDISAAEASSAQDVIDGLINNTRQWQNYRWTNAAARIAQTGMRQGDIGIQLDTLRQYTYSGTQWRIFYSGGLVPIIPTGVSGSGVGMDNSNGLITTVGATTVNVDGCFTNEFRNYRIVPESSGAASCVAINMRVSGSNSVTGYDRTELLARNATVSSGTTLNQTSWVVCGIVNTLIQGSIDISAAFLTAPTTAISQFGVHSNPAASSTTNGLASNYNSHRPSTSYDGFTLTFTAAQSGTVRIYGYA